MDVIRKIGILLAAFCLALAAGLLLGNQIFPGSLVAHVLAMVTCLSGAAVFFGSPYAIISPSRADAKDDAQTRNVMELAMTGTYAAVLLGIVWLGYPLLQANGGSGPTLSSDEIAGLIVLVSAFGFALVCHLFAAIAAGVRLVIPKP
jgi:hypothetical protein